MSLAFNHSILSNAVMPHHWFWWCHHLLLLSLSLPYPTSIFTTLSSKLHHLSSSSYVLLYFNLFLSCSYSYSYYLHNLFLSPLPSQPLPLSTTFTTSSSLHFLHYSFFYSPVGRERYTEAMHLLTASNSERRGLCPPLWTSVKTSKSFRREANCRPPL